MVLAWLLREHTKSRLPNSSQSLTSDEQSQAICSEYHYYFGHLGKGSIFSASKRGLRWEIWSEISRREETFEEIALSDESCICSVIIITIVFNFHPSHS